MLSFWGFVPARHFAVTLPRNSTNGKTDLATWNFYTNMTSKNNTVVNVLYKVMVKAYLPSVKNMELSLCLNTEDLIWFLSSLLKILFVVSLCTCYCLFFICTCRLCSALDANKDYI